jgi:hypothetical protein
VVVPLLVLVRHPLQQEAHSCLFEALTAPLPLLLPRDPPGMQLAVQQQRRLQLALSLVPLI